MMALDLELFELGESVMAAGAVWPGPGAGTMAAFVRDGRRPVFRRPLCVEDRDALLGTGWAVVPALDCGMARGWLLCETRRLSRSIGARGTQAWVRLPDPFAPEWNALDEARCLVAAFVELSAETPK